MKKLIFYFLILFSINLTAQNKINHKHNGNGVALNCKDENTEFYDKMFKSKVNKTKTYVNNSGTQNKDVLTGESTFNNLGRPTVIIIYNEGKILSKKVKKYDSKGNVVELNDYTSDNKISGSMIRKYDEFGREIERNEVDNKGNKLGKTEIKYDSNNGKIEEEQGYSSDNVLVSIKTFIYDNDGNLISKTSKDGTGKELNIESYKYNSAGLRTEDEINYLDAKYKYKYKFEYDNEGNITVMQHLYGDSEVIETYNYKHDNNGNNVETDYRSKAGIHTILTDKYDKNDNKTEEILKLDDGSVSSKTTWEYDNNGNVTGEKQWNVKTGLVSVDTKCIYEYYN